MCFYLQRLTEPEPGRSWHRCNFLCFISFLVCRNLLFAAFRSHVVESYVTEKTGEQNANLFVNEILLTDAGSFHIIMNGEVDEFMLH